MNDVVETGQFSNSGDSTFNAGTVNAGGLFHVIAGHEGFWWPYRQLCRALMQMQQDRSLLLAIHRQMVADSAAILQLEQDKVAKLSARVREFAAIQAGKEPMGDVTTEIHSIYGSAVTSMRELGEAVMNAQLRALEAMRNNAKPFNAAAKLAPAARRDRDVSDGAARPKTPDSFPSSNVSTFILAPQLRKPEHGKEIVP